MSTPSPTVQTTDTLLSISALARARADIPLELFKAIRERGGEVEDCRIAPIGDRIAANLVVSGNWSTLGRLETCRCASSAARRAGRIRTFAPTAWT
jgi:glycine cleavage system regulatory protein